MVRDALRTADAAQLAFRRQLADDVRQGLGGRRVLLIGEIVGDRRPNRDDVDAGVTESVIKHTNDPGWALVTRRHQSVDGQSVRSRR